MCSKSIVIVFFLTDHMQTESFKLNTLTKWQHNEVGNIVILPRAQEREEQHIIGLPLRANNEVTPKTTIL